MKYIYYVVFKMSNGETVGSLYTSNYDPLTYEGFLHLIERLKEQEKSKVVIINLIILHKEKINEND